MHRDPAFGGAEEGCPRQRAAAAAAVGADLGRVTGVGRGRLWLAARFAGACHSSDFQSLGLLRSSPFRARKCDDGGEEGRRRSREGVLLCPFLTFPGTVGDDGFGA
jgi:hypothetical protein